MKTDFMNSTLVLLHNHFDEIQKYLIKEQPSIRLLNIYVFA